MAVYIYIYIERERERERERFIYSIQGGPLPVINGAITPYKWPKIIA